MNRLLPAAGSASGDPAEVTAWRMLALFQQVPTDSRAETMRQVLRRMTDGGADLEARAEALVQRGTVAPAALHAALAAWLREAWARYRPGDRPAWLAGGTAGLSALGVELDVDLVGKLVSGVSDLAKTGACIAGQDALCPYKGPGSVTYSTTTGGGETKLPKWLLPVAIGGGVLLLGGVMLVALKK